MKVVIKPMNGYGATSHPAYLTQGGVIVSNGSKLAQVVFDKRKKKWVATALEKDKDDAPLFVVAASTQIEVIALSQEAHFQRRIERYGWRDPNADSTSGATK